MYILLFLLTRIAYSSNKIFALLCKKKKKKKETLFLPIFITHSFIRVQQLLSTRAQTMKRIKGSDTRIEITFFCPLLCSASINRSMLNQKYIECLSPSKRPRQPRGTTGQGCTFWSLRDPIASLPCYPAVLSKQYAPLAACLRINREHAPLFHPRGAPPRSKLSIESFQGYLCELARKKIGPLSTMVFDDTIGLVSTVGTVYRPGSRSRNRLRGNCAVSVRG